MNVSELLKPLVDKAIATKAYSRETAVEKSLIWLSKELGVPHVALYSLDYEQQWAAHAIVEKASVPPPKKLKKKHFEPPVPIKASADYVPWKPEEWTAIQAIWGTAFYATFFGEWTTVKVEGTISPGQYHIDEIKKANRKVGPYSMRHDSRLAPQRSSAARCRLHGEASPTFTAS